MSYLDTALGAIGAFGRGYGRRPVQQRPGMQPPGMQPQDQNNGPLGMGRMPVPGPGQPPAPGRQSVLGLGMDYLQNRGANRQLQQGGVPAGTIPVGPIGTGVGDAPAPPQNPYANPYPQRPPMTDGEPGMAANGQQFAQGGIVDKPTTAIIGEDGPEMVVPLSGRGDARVSPRNLPRMSYGGR